MTRAEHLAWCKERALEYVDRGDLAAAVASMTSDLGKHEGTRGSVNQGTAMLGMAALLGGSKDVSNWIRGFM